MSFDEVRFPTNISYGSTGGPGYNTVISELRSGFEEVDSRWEASKHRYNARYGVRTMDNLYTVREFFHARRGAGQGFRWKDWGDYATTPNGRSGLDFADSQTPAFDDQVIGQGDGTTKDFQLQKIYASGSVTRTRVITKPRAGTIKAGVNGVEGTEFIDWTANVVTGVITFATPPPNGQEVTAGCEFDVPCRFGRDVDRELLAAIENFNSGSIPDIPIIEKRNGLDVTSEFWYGGGGALPVVADIKLSVLSGRVLRFQPLATGFEAYLPVADELTPGGPYFVIRNDGGVSFDLLDADGNSVSVINAGQVVTVWLSINQSQEPEWLLT